MIADVLLQPPGLICVVGLRAAVVIASIFLVLRNYSPFSPCFLSF